jgi:hypothetical protein
MDALCLRRTEHICSKLWHRYSVTTSQVIVATVKLPKWWLPLNHLMLFDYTPCTLTIPTQPMTNVSLFGVAHKLSLRCLSSSKLTCSKVLRISYSDFRFEIGNGGTLRSRLYVKRDDVIFQIVNFPFISSNIPLALAYGVYIFQLKHYSSAFCAQSRGFLDICWHKSYPKQGYVGHRLSWNGQCAWCIIEQH